MATKLGLYNEALRLIGERRLSSVTEARDHRYHLDDAYADALSYCLEQGYWNFAMRAASLDASDAVEPSFGYAYAFTKPSDWVRTYVISASPELHPPLLRYNDEGGYWFADTDPLYIKYVSNDASYGADLSLWPSTYAHYVSARLAVMTAPSIKSVSETLRDELQTIETRARRDARSKDAMNEPPGFPPRGTWSQARGNGGRRPRSVNGGMIF